jgi:WD40 repeat protein
MSRLDKKKSPIVFFFAAFLAIVIVMFIANRESVLVEKVRFPFNNGVAKLSTYRNFLVAVCLDNKIYVWDWNDLSSKPQVSSVQSNQAALLKSDMVVSLQQRNPKALVVTNLKDDKKYREVPIASNGGRAYLGVSRDRTTVALLLVGNANDGGEASYVLSIVDPDTGRVNRVVRLTKEAAEGQVRNLAVSDDGAFVVLFGEKNGSGWMLLADVKQKRVVWEKEVPELRLFFSAVFSTDSRVIYIRGSDSTLCKVETASGRILERLLPLKENKSTLKSQHAQTVAISPDGRFVAATVFATAYVWYCETGEEIFSQRPVHKLVGSLAFSPDSRFLATSDMRQGGAIGIWRIPVR